MPTALYIQLSSIFTRTLPLLFACILLTCPQARATSIEDLTGSNIIISGDGSTVFYGSGLSYYVRKNGSTSPLPGEVAASSQDGSVILAHNGGSWAIFTGSAASGYTQQATFTHSITGMSPDGTALAGSITRMGSTAVLRTSSDNVNWTSTYLTGISADCYGSDVSNINADGKWVVVGWDSFHHIGLVWFVDASDTSSWTGRSLFGTSVYADSVSADGTLAAGYSTDDSTGKARASIWNTGTGAVTLLDHDASISSGVLGINAAGSVLVGYGNSNGNDQALYWTGSGTSYTLYNLKESLEEAGVSTSGWTLSRATGVSDDGNIIVGIGTLSTDNVVYLANFGAGGLTTTDALYQSLGTMGQVGPAVAGMGQLSMGRLGSVSGGQGMHFAVNTPGGSPAATGKESGLSSGDEMPGSLNLWVVGSVGTNIELNGDDLGLHGGIGLTWEHGEWRVGGGLFGDSRDLDTSYHGNQYIKAVGPGAFVAYSPEDTGLEFRLSGLWQTVNLDLRRGYINGASYATSEGSTNADIFGLSGRVQWTKSVTDYLNLTPFAEYTWQTTHIGSYSESDGPFPASFDSRDETSNSLRSGLRADAALIDNVDTWAWIAWDHRFEGRSSGLGGTVSGLGSFSYAGARVDQDWADTGVGASWDLSERLSANTALGFALGCDDETMSDVTATVGFSYQLW